MAKDQNSYNATIPAGKDQTIKSTITKDNLGGFVYPCLMTSGKVIEGYQNEISRLQKEAAYLQGEFEKSNQFKDLMALQHVSHLAAKQGAELQENVGQYNLMLGVLGQAPTSMALGMLTGYLPGLNGAYKNINTALGENKELYGAVVGSLPKIAEVETATLAINQNLEAILAKDNKNN